MCRLLYKNLVNNNLAALYGFADKYLTRLGSVYLHTTQVVILDTSLLYREFSQNFLRMVSAKQGVAIAARKGGKFKTVFYVASCFVALAVEGFTRTGIAGYLVSCGILSSSALDDVLSVLVKVTD